MWIQGNKQIDQWNKIENPKIEAGINANSTMTKKDVLLSTMYRQK